MTKSVYAQLTVENHWRSVGVVGAPLFQQFLRRVGGIQDKHRVTENREVENIACKNLTISVICIQQNRKRVHTILPCPLRELDPMERLGHNTEMSQDWVRRWTRELLIACDRATSM